MPGGSKEEATGAGAGVDDASWGLLFVCPCQHGFDKSQGRVGGAELAARFGAPEIGKDLTQRIFTGADLVP